MILRKIRLSLEYVKCFHTTEVEIWHSMTSSTCYRSSVNPRHEMSNSFTPLKYMVFIETIIKSIDSQMICRLWRRRHHFCQWFTANSHCFDSEWVDSGGDRNHLWESVRRGRQRRRPAHIIHGVPTRHLKSSGIPQVFHKKLFICLIYFLFDFQYISRKDLGMKTTDSLKSV